MEKVKRKKFFGESHWWAEHFLSPTKWWGGVRGPSSGQAWKEKLQGDPTLREPEFCTLKLWKTHWPGNWFQGWETQGSGSWGCQARQQDKKVGTTLEASYAFTYGWTKGQMSKKTGLWLERATRAGSPPFGMARICEFPWVQQIPGKVIMLEEPPWCDFSRNRTDFQGKRTPVMPAVRGCGMHFQAQELR